jgi:hypothetical protein
MSVLLAMIINCLLCLKKTLNANSVVKVITSTSMIVTAVGSGGSCRFEPGSSNVDSPASFFSFAKNGPEENAATAAALPRHCRAYPKL